MHVQFHEWVKKVESHLYQENHFFPMNSISDDIMKREEFIPNFVPGFNFFMYLFIKNLGRREERRQGLRNIPSSWGHLQGGTSHSKCSHDDVMFPSRWPAVAEVMSKKSSERRTDVGKTCPTQTAHTLINSNSARRGGVTGVWNRCNCDLHKFVGILFLPGRKFFCKKIHLKPFPDLSIF